jgi:uncharacterized repeat protein (TIGR01451 family)
VGYGPAVTKSVEGIPASVGDEVTFILTVTNNGDQILENVILTDPILSYFNILQTSTTKGTASFDTDENVVTVDIGSLEPDEIVIVTIVVEVNNTVTFSAEVPNTAALTYFSEGVTESEPSNTVCFEIEGVPERRSDGLRLLSSLSTLTFGLLAILFCGYGIRRRLQEEKDSRRYITIGVILFLIAIVLYVALVFLPSQAALRRPLFSECEPTARYMETSLSRTFPWIFKSAVNAVKELQIF